MLEHILLRHGRKVTEEQMGAVSEALAAQVFKLPWREAGPPNHHDDKVDSDQ